MSRTPGILASLTLGLLAPATAEAAVWGSFDASRINYAGGVLSSGADHSTLRNIIAANGDTVAMPTGTLTDVYLSGVDVFYTSLLSNGAPVLSGAEQTALTDWVAAGGTLIVTGDIFPLPFYESFTQPFGVTGWIDTGAGTATTSAMHPITLGVTNLDQVTQSTFTFGPDALELATADDGNPFLIVLDPGTGFCSGGRVVVMGDHNIFTDSTIGLAENILLATNLVLWSASPAGGCGVCGDGMIEPGEGCDDGNLADDDACPSTCQPAACGDGFVWAGMEACDDGNMEDTDACTSTCDLAACGDGYVWAGMETCDDGNMEDTDACPSTCEPATCGDGYVWAGMEDCDDANGDDTDACPSTCEDAFCGDGFVWAGMEECDDGNGDNGDACPTGCMMATCGDGYVWAGMEECDDGNLDDTDACPSTCEPAVCGDGFVWEGTEECDDGNEVDDDECSNACESLVMGSTGSDSTGAETDGADTGDSGGGSGAADETGSGDEAGSSGGGGSGGSTGGSGSGGGASDDGGCACTSGERGAPGWMPMLALLGLLRRRRSAR